MSIAMIRDALLWCAVMNYGVLLVWFLFFLLAHDWMYRLHGKWFHLTVHLWHLKPYQSVEVYPLEWRS